MLDGAALDQWSPEALGPSIGYLPQDVQLFDGTVAENIARFSPQLDPPRIVRAARRAGAHEMILRLPKGYDTPIGVGGSALSGGQRQRVGLARALYGDPILVVLDEPNSNLDADGDRALAEAITDLKRQGTTVVVMAHRPSAITAVDKLLVLRDGAVSAFGPRDEVIGRAVRIAGGAANGSSAAGGAPAAAGIASHPD
jgi:ABC-type protease/lipase transport system fused ATPase/permease subunit